MSSTRVIYSIDPQILSRFNAMFAPRERSKVVEQMIQRALSERESGLLEAARKIESEPRFAAIREVSDDIERIVGEAVQDQ